jgi:hypothetical protein
MDANRIIDKLGGTNAVAAVCRIQPPSVSGWRKEGIPPAREDFLRLKFPREFAELDLEARQEEDVERAA